MLRHVQGNMLNHPNVKGEFAVAVRWCRNRLGLSQEQLAERAHLHRTYISDVERAARNLSLESIQKLATALEVSVATLFSHPQSGDQLTSETEAGAKQLVDVLLVEDDPNDIELTLQAFQKSRFTNRVHVVRDGAEALDFIFFQGEDMARRRYERPQVVLLDLNLPKVNGLEVLRRIKGDRRTKSIPVVVLTKSRDDSDITESRRLGAESYIVKPVGFQNLTEVTPQLALNWALIKPAVVTA